MKLALALCAGIAANAPAQNLLVNGDFETPDAGGGFANRYTDFGPGGGWSIYGNLDHIGGFWAAAKGKQSVDLNGSEPAGVSQSFPTTTGHVYMVRYALSENFFGSADKTMQVTWDGALLDNVVVIHDPTRTQQDVKWKYRARRTRASGATSTLGFLSTTGAMVGSVGFAPYYGPAIDDVSVFESGGCDGDLNNDSMVDDSDFVIFVVAYNILDCADETMPEGCPADLNGDGVVDDTDFSIFAVAYNELVCP